METATLFRLAALRGVQAGCVLAVSDLLGPARGRIDPDALEAAARAHRPHRRRGARRLTRAQAAVFWPRRALLAAAARVRVGLRAAGRRAPGLGHGCGDGVAGRPPAGCAELAGDVRELRPRAPTAGPRSRRAAARASPAPPIAPTRSSTRSSASSTPSSRCETERTRRVSRSRSPADGRLSAPIATSCACAAFSRASNAREIAPLTNGLSSSSCARRAERVLALA